MLNKHKLNLIQWNGIERMEWYGLDLSSCLEILESFEVKRDLGNSDLKEKNHDSVAVTLSPVENWKFNVFFCLWKVDASPSLQVLFLSGCKIDEAKKHCRKE